MSRSRASSQIPSTQSAAFCTQIIIITTLTYKNKFSLLKFSFKNTMSMANIFVPSSIRLRMIPDYGSGGLKRAD
jgi:hypothetical protein